MRLILIMLACLGLWTPAHTQTAEDLDRKTRIEAMDANATKEQRQRKARSIQRLERMGIPVLESLPVIASESDALRRSDQEVIERALALMIVALKGETGDQDLVDTVIAQYGAQGLFTPREKALLRERNPTQQERAEMTWRYESVAVLLWATGHLKRLPPPGQIIDAAELGNIFRKQGGDGIRRTARLRPQAELLDAADLAYRMNWAAVDARVNGALPPEGLHPGITYERHYAFNWLIGYMGLSWDKMRTDT